VFFYFPQSLCFYIFHNPCVFLFSTTQGLWKIKKHKDCGKYKNTRIVENIKTQGLWKIKKHKDCGKYKNRKLFGRLSVAHTFISLLYLCIHDVYC
jgi:hypothetical protein